MHKNAILLTLALTATIACLPEPRAPRDAAAPGPDAPPAPPRVLHVVVTDLTGAKWEASAIPQRPLVHVEFSEPVEEPPPLWLFFGGADEDLVEDLTTSPLRIATEARAVPASLHGAREAYTLAPHGRLAPGERVTLAVAAWLRDTMGMRMDAPFTRELVVSDAPEAGARVTASWPPDGAAAVPLALPALAVRFDGPVSGIERGLVLAEVETAAQVPGRAAASDCAAVGFESGFCATFMPARALAPLALHQLVVDERVVDATGAPVGPWEARFSTNDASTDAPPSLVPIECALDEQDVLGACVLADDSRIALRIQADEPVRLALSIDSRTRLALAPRGSATLVASGLAPDRAYAANLRIEDLAGHIVEQVLELRTHEPLATLSLVEVRSDPRGAEPRQEYVEVLNYGAVTVDLAGVSLSDRADAIGDVVETPHRLAPGQRALFVADAFDPDDSADPVVPPGVMLVRIGSSLGSGGLTNAGEPIYLRDASMRRLSAVPAIAAPGACLVRTGADPRAGDAELFEVAPCTPGTAP